MKHTCIPRVPLTAESDLYCTPYYGVTPILKYIKPKSTIWCPFDKEDSNFVKCFKDNGFNVIHSHIDDNKDFLNYYPNENFDVIISNPPFSIKDKVLSRLFEIDKPFALIYPLPSIQHSGMFDQLKECQFLIFDKRIGFLHYETKEHMKGVSFASIYLCRNLLPEKIIFERLSSS